jgi:hypothetical protein
VLFNFLARMVLIVSRFNFFMANMWFRSSRISQIEAPSAITTSPCPKGDPLPLIWSNWAASGGQEAGGLPNLFASDADDQILLVSAI